MMELVNAYGVQYVSKNYNMPASTLYKWTTYQYHYGKLRKPGGGRKTVLSSSDEQQLLAWVHTQNQHKIAVSQQALQAKARILKDGFKATNSWAQGFKKRHNLSLRSPTLGSSASEHSANELQQKIQTLWQKVHTSRLQHNIDLSFIGNMDEVPVWFENTAKKTLTTKGAKTVVVRTSGK